MEKTQISTAKMGLIVALSEAADKCALIPDLMPAASIIYALTGSMLTGRDAELAFQLEPIVKELLTKVEADLDKLQSDDFFDNTEIIQ